MSIRMIGAFVLVSVLLAVPAVGVAGTPTKFTLKNNASKTVRVFIGTKPKYGSGRTTYAGGNSIGDEPGYVGDQVCIVDDHENPISCKTLTQGTKRLDIARDGVSWQ